MDLLNYQTTMCPHCGAETTLELDSSEPDQEYVEDCQVCCQPMVVHLTTDVPGEPHVMVTRENE